MKRGGFTMLEMLGVLIILGSFVLLATRLFHASTRASHAAAQQASDANRVDAVLSTLRADVWNARVTAVEGGALVIVQGVGKTVTWRVDETKSLSRAAAGEPTRTWPQIRLEFSVDGPEVLVHVVAPLEGSARLVSQVQLAGSTP